ncbi:MAG: hypothetical protein AABY34_06415 [Pseudomonadota bacterium]
MSANRHASGMSQSRERLAMDGHILQSSAQRVSANRHASGMSQSRERLAMDGQAGQSQGWRGDR